VLRAVIDDATSTAQRASEIAAAGDNQARAVRELNTAIEQVADTRRGSSAASK
jgi:methyl-accepting chemotaxis protein